MLILQKARKRGADASPELSYFPKSLARRGRQAGVGWRGVAVAVRRRGRNPRAHHVRHGRSREWATRCCQGVQNVGILRSKRRWRAPLRRRRVVVVVLRRAPRRRRGESMRPSRRHVMLRRRRRQRRRRVVVLRGVSIVRCHRKKRRARLWLPATCIGCCTTRRCGCGGARGRRCGGRCRARARHRRRDGRGRVRVHSCRLLNAQGVLSGRGLRPNR